MDLRPATPPDLATIRDVAERTWRVCYPAIISTEQVEAMLSGMFAEEVLAARLAEGERFLLAEDGTGAATGFIGYGRELASFGGAGITKLYVLPEAWGKGVGRALMEGALAELADAGAVRLRVNRRNTAGVNFYFQLGFRIERWIDSWYDEERYGRRFLLDDYLMIRD